MINFSDTICAPATVAGTGAIAIIRISGTNALQITDRVVRFKKGTAAESKGYTLKRGVVFAPSEKENPAYGEVIDDVLVAVFHSPNSYTGEDSSEIYCHSSRYIVTQILNALLKEGCRMAEAGEFTRRAFVNGKMDLAQAEAVADVIASNSQAQHRVAMTQLRGGYSAKLSELRDKLVEITSLMELELDFSEEDLEFADRTQLCRLADEAITQCKSLSDSFKVGNAIKNGIPVAIIGAPNSGKSTLLNTLLGEDRAIVSDIPGTTRDTLEECISIGGILFRFIDTAGIRSSENEIEQKGIERAFRKLSEAEIILWVTDSSIPADTTLLPFRTLKDRDNNILLSGAETSSCHTKLNIPEESKIIVLFNKNDLCGCANKNVISDNILVNLPELKGNIIGSVSISAKTGNGIDELKNKLVETVSEGMKSTEDDAVLVTNMRHAEALKCACKNLLDVKLALNASVPADLIAEDLRSAIRHIGEITGEITTDEVLGNIFSRFCIGK